MADGYNSDDDKYANESFETESDTDHIPERDDDEISPDDADVNELVTNMNSSGSFAAMYGKRVNINKLKQVHASNGGVYRHRRDYATYLSSSDDESDVIVSETVAEINTEPMRMEDAVMMTPKKQSPMQLKRPLANVDKQSKMSFSEDTAISDQSDDDDSDSDNGYGNNQTIIEQTKSMIDDVMSSCSDDDSDNVRESDVSDTESGSGSGSGSEGFETDNCVKASNSEFDSESMYTNATESNMTVNTTIQKPPNNHHDDDDVNNNDDDDDGGEEIVDDYDGETEYDDAGDYDDNDMEDTKQVASNHTFTQSTSRTTLAINCESCMDMTETPASSDTNLLTYNVSEPAVDMRFHSRTPSSFNSDEYAYHMDLIPSTTNSKSRLKAPPRKSWSFTNMQMREIERTNQILLKKILTQKPTYCLNPSKKTKNDSNKYTQANININNFKQNNRITSAAVNRKKQQRQIDLDNQVLKRKIEAISLRRPML